jgi:hypothetical protein
MWTCPCVLLINHHVMQTYREMDVQLHHSWPRHYMHVSGQLHVPAPLPPGKEPPVPIGLEAGWAPEPVWTTRGRENPSPCRKSKPGLPSHRSSLCRLSYPGFDLGVGGGIISNFKWVVRIWAEFDWFSSRSRTGFYENGSNSLDLQKKIKQNKEFVIRINGYMTSER